jgi:ERCC4-type nuclease
LAKSLSWANKKPSEIQSFVSKLKRRGNTNTQVSWPARSLRIKEQTIKMKREELTSMSGLEPLFSSLKKPAKNEHPTIIVDTREANSAPKIAAGLREFGAEIRLETLQTGDYIISDQCAVERKTVHDFVHTLTRRFLFEQLSKLKEMYLKPFILIEGYMPIVYRFSKIQPSSVWGAMFALAKQGINMIHTNSYKETVDFLYTAAKQEQIVEKRTPVVHHVKPTETLHDQQIFFLASLPSIGREKAISLLNSYQTPINALQNLDKWTKDAHGLGPAITKKVKQVLYLVPKNSNTYQKTSPQRQPNP